VRFKRTTAMALAASATLVVGSGVVASAAVLDLPLFGFGHEATRSAASPATTTPPVSVVEQTVYDDHYVTAPGAPSGGTSGMPARVTAGGAAAAPAPTAARAPAPVPATAPPAAPAPTAPPTTAPPASPGSPPPGCVEPQWDPEHKVWQCSNTGGSD